MPQAYHLGMAESLPIKLVMTWGWFIFGIMMLQDVYDVLKQSVMLDSEGMQKGDISKGQPILQWPIWINYV